MRLPDDLFNLVFTFLDSIEIMAWTAESVRTKHAIARKLCKIVNGLDMETGYDKCVPRDMFWAHERMLDVDVPQRSSRGIDFESALFWLFHFKIYKTVWRGGILLYEWQKINTAMLQSLDAARIIEEMCVAIGHEFFGTCDIATRIFIERSLLDITRRLLQDTCCILNCPCYNF